jgi:hypothetical protein
MSEHKGIHAEGGSAPAPTVLGSSPTNIIQIHHPGGTAGKKNYKLDDLIPASLSGLGTVDLVALELSFLATKAGAHVYAGLKTTLQSSLTAKMLGMSAGGISYVATEYNAGKKNYEVLVPPGIASVQIRPIPSDRPQLEFCLDLSEGIEWHIKVVISIRDTMVYWCGSLNLA